ncbi:MAG: DEAD/DEAH box helicase [Deltaproteobacteria bacterium]|nr:DEAD/DEAH box helicase [Deltaproteobacteria bacterium]
MADILRPYQRQGIHNIFKEWRSGTRSVLFQMPTGTGKTVLFSEIVKKGHDHQRKILIIAHRKELIAQIIGKLQSKNIETGVIVAGERSDYSKIVQVASIQTLTRRVHPAANLIIIDEAHHAKARSYKKLWQIYPDAKFLGVTATPVRLSGAGFDDLFDVLIPTQQIKDFIKDGYLSQIKHFIGATPDLKGVRRRQGDYVIEMLSRIMLDHELMANLLESYQKVAAGKSTIVFAVNVDHSKRIAERYTKAGIAAAHIDGSTPANERHLLLEQFRAKEIHVLSNVEIITEGFDFPECEVVQLARPTKSLGLYLQMVGRVMRVAKGKTHGIVLDNAGLWLEHGLPTIDREWSLEGVKKNSQRDRNIDVVAKDRDGVLKEVTRTVPHEVEGLELIEFTEELERLLVFETYLQNAKLRSHKLLAPYYRYIQYLEQNKIQLSPGEFHYIKQRLNKLNAAADPEEGFKSGFWFVQEKKLKYHQTLQTHQTG